MLNPHQTVASLVLDHSECAAIFQSHRIDFCCRGDLSIEDACSDRGLDPAALIQELARAIAERMGPGNLDPRTLSTPALIAHIISDYHERLRRTLPFVELLAAKVSRVHGSKNPYLLDLQRARRLRRLSNRGRGRTWGRTQHALAQNATLHLAAACERPTEAWFE